MRGPIERPIRPAVPTNRDVRRAVFSRFVKARANIPINDLDLISKKSCATNMNIAGKASAGATVPAAAPTAVILLKILLRTYHKHQSRPSLSHTPYSRRQIFLVFCNTLVGYL